MLARRLLQKPLLWRHLHHRPSLSSSLPSLSTSSYSTATGNTNTRKPRTTLGIRAEDPTRLWERRCPLTPDAVARLIADGVQVVVQPCNRRVFKDREFVEVSFVLLLGSLYYVLLGRLRTLESLALCFEPSCFEPCFDLSCRPRLHSASSPIPFPVSHFPLTSLSLSNFSLPHLHRPAHASTPPCTPPPS